MAAFDLGVMFRREDLPENVVAFSQRAEAAGFDEVWIVEDCFYPSGIAPVTAALAATSSIRVGLGIMPAVARNAVFTAMEIATLARLYPGRFLPGLGHGVKGWMQQIGALPTSQLAALGETTEVVRALLRGETVSYNGRHVYVEEATLVYPPDDVPPVGLGVRGPKSLALSGRVADGTILAEGLSPAYVRWAIAHINQGRAEADRHDPHRITVYVPCAVDQDGDTALEKIRLLVAENLVYGNPHYWQALGIAGDVQALIAAGGADPVAHITRVMPSEWLHALAVTGTPQQGLETIQRLVEAGADSVVLVPLPGGNFMAQLEAFSRTILPELGR